MSSLRRTGGGLRDMPLEVAIDALDSLRLVASDVITGSDLGSENFDDEVLLPMLEELLGREEADVRYCVRDGRRHRRHSLWCSEACRRKDVRARDSWFVGVRTTCAKCREPMTAQHSDKHYCSPKCRYDAWRDRQLSE